MKKIFLWLTLSSFIVINLQGQINPEKVSSSNWQFVGNEGLSVGLAMYQSIATSPSGEIHIAFSDEGHSGKLTVLKFDGTNWIPVGLPGFTNNVGASTSLAFSPAGQLYLAFWDGSSGGRATVMKYDGSAWVNEGVPGFSAGAARDISLAFSYSGVPYIAFTDDSDTSKVTVMKFDSTGWVNVGSPGFSARYAQFTSLAFLPSGEPCVAYADGNAGLAVVVKKFDGVDWNYMGPSGFSHDAMYISITIAPSGEPYLAYAQNGDTLKGIVEKFDGTSWVQVGPSPFTLQGGGWTKLVFSPEGQPYVAYVIENYQKANVSKFDGTNWVNVGDMNFSPGAAYYLGLAFNSSGQPYVVFQDHYDTLKTSVMYYPDDSIVMLHVYGTVSDSLANPIPNNPVMIDNDTINGSFFVHHRIVYTNSSGVYNDTILLPSDINPWNFIIRTYDCKGGQYYCWADYNGTSPVIHHDFTIYSCENPSCHAEFVAYPDSASPLTYHFLDQSYGNIGSWHWNFGDGNTSTQQNPVHTFSTSGVIYHVCLRVVTSDSVCSNVYCSDVLPGTSGCQAIFAHYPDSLVQNGVKFFNFSIGHLPAFHWDFGDNTYSTLKNPVHSFPAPGNYQVCLSITDGLTGCNTTKCVDILVQNTANCSSSFTYTVSGLNVDFLGQMTNQQPATYTWEFGDDQTGQGSSIVHTYPNAGTFNVGLTTVDSWGCSYYTTQPVIVPDSSNLHYIYGQVFAGNFPMISGMVMLYSKDTVPPFTPYFDLSMVDLNGVYYFVFYPGGDYYLYAMPSLPAGYLPTYYGNVLHWNDAKVISTGHETNPYNIQLLPATPMNTGNGLINGHITVSSLKTILIYKIMMLLSDSAGNTISYDEVTNEGDFNFNYLAYGTYYLKAETPGVNSDRIKVVLSPDKPDANVLLTFTGNSIIGINDPGNLINSITVYPNPVGDKVNISLHTVESMTLNFEIINMTGEILQRMQTEAGRGSNHYILSTGSLHSGIYSLRISSDKGYVLNKKLVKLN